MDTIHSVSDEVRANPWFRLRELYSRFPACLDTLQHPCDIPSQCPHGLQAFSVLLDFLHGVAVSHVPVLRTGNDHVADHEVLIESFEGCGIAPSPRIDYAGSDLSAHLTGIGIEEAVHPRADLSCGTGVVYGGTEDESVEFIDPLPDLVGIVIDDAFSFLLAVSACFASGDLSLADPMNLGLDTFLLQSIRHLPEGGVRASVLVGASVYEEYLHVITK